MARKERFLCDYNAYVGDCSGFKNRRLGRKGIFHSAISRRYKHGAHLSFLCYLLLCYGHWERRHACFSQEPILPRIQSVKRSVCGWGIVSPSPERKTGFETLTVGVRELETHISPPQKMGIPWGSS